MIFPVGVIKPILLIVAHHLIKNSDIRVKLDILLYEKYKFNIDVFNSKIKNIFTITLIFKYSIKINIAIETINEFELVFTILFFEFIIDIFSSFLNFIFLLLLINL